MKNKLILLSILPFALSVASCNKANGDGTIKFDYIYTAQPVVAATNSTIFENVQTSFKTKTQGKEITQASIFVNNNTPTNLANAFLSSIAASISAGVAAPALIKAGIETVGETVEQQNKFGVPGAMAMKVTAANNGFSLGFKVGVTIKDEIQDFVNIVSPAVGTIPGDAFYTYEVPENNDGTGLDISTLKVICPTGAPAVAMYSLASNSNFETTSNPQTGLMPNFKTDNYDIIVAPTHGGLMQIVKQKANYKLAATITFGMFYIIASGNDSDGVINEGDKVLAFQESDVPGLVFKYLYGDLNLDVTYVAAASDTKLVIENDFTLKVE